MKYCRLTQSMLGKKPTITCSTLDDEILIAIFSLIMSFIVYLAIRVSKIPVGLPKKDETKQCRPNGEQDRQEDSIKPDGGTISARKSDCTLKSRKSSETEMQSVLPTHSQMKSEKEAIVDDSDETSQQIDMKFVDMRRTSSGQFENDILVNYCLVDNFDRFGILNKMSSDSSNEMTTDGDMREENSDEEKSGDNHSGVNHVRSISYEKPIGMKDSDHEMKNFNLTSAEKNSIETREATELKVSRNEKNVTVCESTLALSDKNSTTGSFSFSQFYMSDDSTQNFEKIQKFSVQKVKKWKMAPRPSSTIPKKATSLRPQVKINPIKSVTSQTPDDNKLFTGKNRTKVEGNGKIRSSLNIHAKHRNFSTNNKQLVKLRPNIIKKITSTKLNRTPVNLVGVQSLSDLSPIENKKISMVEKVFKQNIIITPTQLAFEEEAIRNEVEKECMDKIINLTKNVDVCDKNLVNCEDTLNFSNTHQSPSGDNSEKVEENSVEALDKQPISLGSLCSSGTGDLRKQKSPVNFPENLRNEVELLQSNVLSRVENFDKPHPFSKSTFKEEIIRNALVRENRDKIINSTKNLEGCNRNDVSFKDPLTFFNKEQSPNSDYAKRVKNNSCKVVKKQPISLGAFVGTCDLREQKSPVNVPENLKNEADLLRSKILSRMKECDKLYLKLSCKGETLNPGNDSLRNLKRKVSDSIGEIQCGIVNEIEGKRKKEITPSTERDNLESFVGCATSEDDDGEKAKKNISEKSHQEVQDLNKSKIVTNILKSLSETKAFSNSLEENVHATGKREYNIENNSSNQVAASKCKISLAMVDKNGNLSDINTNETTKPFAVVNKFKMKFKDFSHSIDSSTSTRKLPEQRCSQTIAETVSSDEDCRLDRDKMKCRRTALCKNECRCNANNS